MATLDVLDRQRLDGLRAEVVVVDNGSSDGTVQALGARSGSLPVRVVEEPRPGASAARNRGIEAAAAPLLLLLGDDTPPVADDLFLRHVELHRRDPDTRYGVLGRIEWGTEQGATPFMRWLDDAGFQFSFSRLERGPVSPARYLYSSHVSLKRRMVEEMHGFDEEFRYLLEDTELGIRLERAGLRLDYRPELVVRHEHVHDPDAYARRMAVIGAEARRLHAKWGAAVPPEVRVPSARWNLYRLAEPLCRVLAASGVPAPVRERAWAGLLLASYARGYRRGGAIPSPPGRRWAGR